MLYIIYTLYIINICTYTFIYIYIYIYIYILFINICYLYKANHEKKVNLVLTTMAFDNSCIWLHEDNCN